LNTRKITPAILYEPDGYQLDGQRLMGRQAAGNGFLRAAVSAAAGGPVVAYTTRSASSQAFSRTVKSFDAQAKPQWLDPGRTDALRALGHLYLPGPNLGEFARQRLRTGPSAWSLTGVTHTTASHSAMDSIVDLLSAPVMPWDALVCTSSSVVDTVKTVLAAQKDYLRWRFGGSPHFTLPQLPVIPLGVHCEDFDFSSEDRAAARQALGIAEDEVVALFVGRLSFHAKAHPHAMYQGLQVAARASKKKLVLVQCGWFANEAIEAAFKEGAAQACPDVRCLFTSGRDAAQRKHSWAGADLFISLSDNVQETFGLTPIEAMAAGLPVVVSDWDGYKDTVREGIDGFRIPTWMPAPGGGEGLARAHERGLIDYDHYCAHSCMRVAMDHQVLAQRLTDLVSDAPLRSRLGAAARTRARELYSWAAVYRAYEQLWGELDRLRPRDNAAAAPQAAAARLDPFSTFASYPTHRITLRTRLAKGEAPPDLEALLHTRLFSFAGPQLMPRAALAGFVAQLESGPLTVADLQQALGSAPAEAATAAAILGKMGVLRLLA
jgi:starch synthase